MTEIIRRKPSSFEEYWLASKAWERKGLPLGTARALVNAGFLTVDDLHTAHRLELASIPRVGAKSLAILYKFMEPHRAHGGAVPAHCSPDVSKTIDSPHSVTNRPPRFHAGEAR